jgi:hypothetical protein
MRKSAILLSFALASITVLLSNPATAARWGKLALDSCSGPKYCTARYAAILWDIPDGVDWKYACEHTPHSRLGLPSFCHITFNAWGNWLVENEPACGAWCGGEGLRKKKKRWKR